MNTFDELDTIAFDVYIEGVEQQEPTERDEYDEQTDD